MFVFQICTGDRMSVSLGDPSISSIHRSFVVLHPYVYVFVLRYDHCHVPYQKYQKAHNKLRSACRQILILDKEASFLLWSMSQRPLAAGEDSILCFKLRAIVSPMSTSERAYGPAWKPMAVCVAASARCIIWSSLFRRPDDLVAAKVRAEQQSVPWHSAPACGFCFSTRPDHDYLSSDAPLWIRIGPNIKQT
jgi:hypothetical protein